VRDADSLSTRHRRRWTVLLAPIAALVLLLLLRAGLRWLAAYDAVLGFLAVRLAESAAWLAGTWLAIRLLDLLLWDRLVPWWIGMRAPGLLRQFVGVLVAAAGTAVMLHQTWDLALSAVLATTGVLGIVLGLAMRGILADFFSGIALNLEKPFDLGDFVLMRMRGHREPFAGTVREINWRSTRLLTPEDNLVSIPNSVVAAAIVENLSYPSPVSELEADLTLAWEVNQQRAEQVLQAAATEAWALGATAGDKPPKLRICRIDGQGVTWRIVYLLDPRKRAKGPARHTLLACVHKHLLTAGMRPASLPGSGGTGAADGAFVRGVADMPVHPLDHDDVQDRLKVLGTVELLRSLATSERSDLAAALHVRRVPAAQPVVRSGDAGDSMFVVVEGTLAVHVPGGDAAAAGDDTRPLELRRANVLGPGRVFGEMAMLTGEARSATVVPLAAAVLYEIGQTQMAPLLAARPALAEDLARAMAQHQERDAATAEAARRQRATSEAPRSAVQQMAARIRAWLK
jgi:small-conductance mechanosensitive channel/CRP-like cAMP-binding protein